METPLFGKSPERAPRFVTHSSIPGRWLIHSVGTIQVRDPAHAPDSEDASLTGVC